MLVGYNVGLLKVDYVKCWTINEKDTARVSCTARLQRVRRNLISYYKVYVLEQLHPV